jgi:hypothetical protein
MASIVSKPDDELQVHQYGPRDAPITVFYFNGFIGRVMWSAGLSLEGEELRSDSMFWPVLITGDVRIVLVEHPARPITPEVDFVQLSKYLGPHNVISGLSRGGQVASMFHRWLLDQGREDMWSRLGLVLISTPGSVDHLASAGMVRAIQRLHLPYSLGGPLMRRFGLKWFLGDDVAGLLEEANRPFDLAYVRESIRSSHWMIATTRGLATFPGFGEPMWHPGVVAVNVPTDEVIHVEPALVQIQATYLDCEYWVMTGTSGHGRPDLDLEAYRILWLRVYARFAALFNLEL